jgi:chloride channel protein, CIC family
VSGRHARSIQGGETISRRAVGFILWRKGSGPGVNRLGPTFDLAIFRRPLIRRYTALVRADLRATYTRDIRKWFLVAPIIGVITGVAIAALNVVILNVVWAAVLPFYLRHHWSIWVGLAIGFLLTGLIMQYLTPDPNEHSTEEIIRSYHEHQGDIDVHSFWWKMLASVTTVGSGGSAALEGPSIYAGGAIGSWLWTRLRRFGLDPRDRRIMLITGAASGMAAVFRAPLTGLMFALEVPYKDDLVHEATLPSLIGSVVAYAMLVLMLGAQPIFGFVGSTSFRASDLVWSAILGLGCGLAALVYDITFRRVRDFFVTRRIPHTFKLLAGGLVTALCGAMFITVYPGPLIPIGPNYEAVRMVLARPYPGPKLIVFAVLKMAASIASIGSGGVSAVFVPLILIGGSLGGAFGQLVAHAGTVDLYAAVGMAAFIAAGYKTPLTAVVFVAETTGGHSFIIPSLIGAAVAYAISGEASVSGDQRVHELARIPRLEKLTVADVMQRGLVSVQASATLAEFMHGVAASSYHAVFPVCDRERPIGTVSIADLARVPTDRWGATAVREVTDHETARIPPDCDLMEALSLLVKERGDQMLLVVSESGALKGIVTKTDVLRAFGTDEVARGTRRSRTTGRVT